MNLRIIVIFVNFLFESVKSNGKYFHLTDNGSHNILNDDKLVKKVTFVPGVSKSYCSVMCASSKTCVYFDYNPNNETCSLPESGLNTQIDAPPVMSGSERYMLSAGLIVHVCDTPTDCVVANSECRTEGICGCKAGYSFQQSTQTCVTDCIIYGNTFQFFYNKYLLYRNVEYFDGPTAAQCAHLCIEATNYTSRSFDADLKPEPYTCYTQEEDPSDAPGAYVSGGSGAGFYQRNCA